MKFVKLAVSAAAISLMLGATAAVAWTSDSDNETGCAHLQKKVSAALDANQSNASYSDAVKLAHEATSYCNSRMYRNGIDRYTKVLSMLGAAN
jgi:hypothetical protein